MTDFSKLKALAEGVPFHEVEWYQPDSFGISRAPTLADREFISAANPKAVLALIAENERIKARLCVCRDCGGQGEIYSGHSSYQGYNQPPEPDMDVCGTCGGDGVLGPLEDFESLAAERDQLKTECEGLRDKASCVDDCAAIIRKLVHKLRKAAPDNAFTDPAMDYLRRKGLQGSPLRSSEGVEPVLDTPYQSGKWSAEDEASSRTIYGQWANLCEYVPWVEGGNSLKQEEARRMHCAIEGKAYCYGR